MDYLSHIYGMLNYYNNVFREINIEYYYDAEVEINRSTKYLSSWGVNETTTLIELQDEYLAIHFYLQEKMQIDTGIKSAPPKMGAICRAFNRYKLFLVYYHLESVNEVMRVPVQ